MRIALKDLKLERLIVALTVHSVSKTAAPAAVHAGLNQAARDGKFEFAVAAVRCGVHSVGDPSVLGKAAQGQ